MTSLMRMASVSNAKPLDKKSRPFVLNSMIDTPGDIAGVMQIAEDSSNGCASTSTWSKRHLIASTAQSTVEKPLPVTVTGVPPSAAPRNGQTADSVAGALYVKAR
jgi:hypothetical protein